MSVESRRAEAFERSLWSDYPELVRQFSALYDHDKDAFHAREQASWAARDTKPLLAMIEVLERKGALEPEHLHQAGISMITLNRPLQALGFLNDKRLRVAPSPKLAHQRARAFAAAGRFLEALEACEDALRIRNGFAPALELIREIARLQVLQFRTESSADWNDWRRLVEACLALRARQDAARHIARAMTLTPPSKKNRIKDMVFLLDTGLDLGLDPQEVEHFLRAAIALHPKEGLLRALQVQCELMRGRPDAALRDAAEAGESSDGNLRYAIALAQEASGDVEGACAALARLSSQHMRDQDIRNSLAECVGADVLKGTRFNLRRGAARKIINVFPFSDELSLLKVRLHEMAPWVDQFVLVEAGQTFVGGKKPLCYREHQDQFAEFRSKITHLPLERFPDHICSAWARDFYQRDIAIRAIAETCGEDDLIYITDVDEVVDQKAVEGFDGDFARLHMGLYRFFLNYRPIAQHPLRNGRTGAVWKARHLQKYGLSFARFRLARLEKDWARILDAGWHFSSIGHAEQIARKYNSFAHQEIQLAERRNQSAVEAMLERIKAGEMEPRWERCEIDDSFPSYIRQNQDEFAGLIL